MSERKSFQLGFFLSLIFALLVYFYLYGSAFLFPAETHWLMQGDPSQHFFGFNFFLSETWHWPLGLIENFNWPFQTSIVYTDSIPLVAIPLKLLFQHQSFQFHGLWILLCFLMQGGVGFWFLFRASEKMPTALGGSVILTLFPSFLMRGFDPSRHYSCLAHFLIFPALTLAIDSFQNRFKPLAEEKYRRRFWFLIFILALAIHFYFFYLNLLIFLIAERKLFTHRAGMKALAVYATILLPLMWAFGYFVIPLGRSFEGGFASYSMNFLSWFNPEGYSALQFQLPTVSSDQREGFQYLGLGLIFLIVAVLAQNQNRKLLQTHARELMRTPAVLLLVFFLLFAFSIRFSLGTLALPDFLTAPLYGFFFYWLLCKIPFSKINSILISIGLIVLLIFSGHLLRSSGRAGWYVSYFFIFLLFRLKPKPWLVVVAAVLQCMDVAPMLSHIRSENQALLHNNQTFEIAETFSHAGLIDFLGSRDAITLIDLSPNEQAPIAQFALLHHLKLGPVYVARGQIKKSHSWTEDEKEKIKNGSLTSSEVMVTIDANPLNTWANSEKVVHLKIGKYLWIKAAEKN